MSAKKPKIQKIEAPTTNNRVEQLRYLAKLRGEFEEEAPKLNVKRFLIISAIIVVILVAGLIFVSGRISQINAYNDEIDSANRMAAEAANAYAEEYELKAKTDAKMSEILAAAQAARAQVTAGEEAVEEAAAAAVQPAEDHSQPIRVVFLPLISIISS